MKEIVMPKLNRRKVILLVAICLAVVLLGTIIGVGAKYIRDFASVQSQVLADDFYFTVDLLGDTQEKKDLSKEIHLYGGEAKSLSFQVQNYFDDLRINEKDVSYTVSLSCDRNDYSGYSFSAGSAGSYTLSKGAKAINGYTVNLPEGYAALHGNTTVTATVKSTNPYVKEMKLHFVLHGQPEPVVYRVEDQVGGTYATLIVMASETINAGNLKLDWSAVNSGSNLLQVDTNSKHILDGSLVLTTNDPNSGFLNQATTTQPMEENESILIYFFKADPTKDYSTVGELVAEESGGVYTVAIKEHANY